MREQLCKHDWITAKPRRVRYRPCIDCKNTLTSLDWNSPYSNWSRRAYLRSTAAPTVLICTLRTRGPLGESEQRLYALNGWRETPFYTDRERAALGWAEAITLISQSHASDEEFEAARAHFSEVEPVNLTMAIIMINSWNRLAIAFRAPVGTYQPRFRNK